jgi:hypothetical protein
MRWIIPLSEILVSAEGRVGWCGGRGGLVGAGRCPPIVGERITSDLAHNLAAPEQQYSFVEPAKARGDPAVLNERKRYALGLRFAKKAPELNLQSSPSQMP